MIQVYESWFIYWICEQNYGNLYQLRIFLVVYFKYSFSILVSHGGTKTSAHKRNLITAPHAELLWIFTEFHHIVSKKIFRIVNMHFNMMEAKTVLTNFYSRNHWSNMRYMMNLNPIMALIFLSSKMMIFMERKQKFLSILEQKGILSLNFDLHKRLQHSRMKTGSLIL